MASLPSGHDKARTCDLTDVKRVGGWGEMVTRLGVTTGCVVKRGGDGGVVTEKSPVL